MAKKKAAAKEVERKVLSNGVILIKYDDGSYALLTPISAEDAEEIFGGESEDSDDEDEDDDEDKEEDDDDDEDDDEDEDEEEERPRRRPAKKAPVKKPVRRPRVDEYEDEDDEDEDEEEEEERPRRKKGKSKDWQSKNFLDDDDLEFEFLDLK